MTAHWKNQYGQQGLKPICRRYELMVFKRSEASEPSGESEDQPSVVWAVGFASDGQHELVGVWSATSASSSFQAWFRDLRTAGLQRVRFVSAPPSMLAGSLRDEAADLGAMVLPQVQALLRTAEAEGSKGERSRLWTVRQLMRSAAGIDAAERLVRDLVAAARPGQLSERLQQVLEAIQGLVPVLSFGPRRCDLVLRGDERVLDLEYSLIRSVKRHGGFGSADEAVAFAAQALERELGRSSRLEVTPLHRGALKADPLLATVRETMVAIP